MPGDVALARLDVPPPGGAASPLESWTRPYFYAVDEGRAVENRLDFFYFPTLYVLDREGEVRYAGGCDEAALRTMIAEIRAERPADERRVSTPPLPAVGSAAPALSGRTLAGDEVALRDLHEKGPALLVFTSISCPFSREAVEALPDLAGDLEENDVSVLAIEKGGGAEAVRVFHEERDLAVLHDADGSISRPATNQRRRDAMASGTATPRG